MPEGFSLEIESSQARHVIHLPEDRQRERLVDLLRRVNLPLNTRCGQRGLCDACLVELVSGTLVHIGSGELLSANGQARIVRGCEYRLSGNGAVKIRIPPRSLLAYLPQIVTDFRINVPRAHHPMLQTLLVERAGLPDGCNVIEGIGWVVSRQLNSGRAVKMSDAACVDVAKSSAAQRWYVSVELREDCWLISRVTGEAQRPALGAAIDIGTTTVALLLVDLGSGEVVGQSAMFNQQMSLGDDVVTRISLCVSDPAMVGRLHEAVTRKTIVPLLREAMEKAGAAAEQVQCFSVAGNTTMLHLLAGISPASMGVAPFTPTFLDHRVWAAADIFGENCGQFCLPTAPVHLLPGPAAYVGADLSAGILANGLLYDDGPSLLVDVGTNGEIILKHAGKLYGCATAAGSAFEGAGLSCGIRAGDGAISHISLAKQPFAVGMKWIDQSQSAKPAGLCGSAYVDFLSEARRVGLLTATGRFDLEAIPGAASHILENGTDRAIRIARGQGGQEIFISERDIARLLQAKAAIAAGILTLLERVGLAASQIKTLYLAGGFGTHMNRAHAIGCGLLPGFSTAQIQSVGNTSLAGAYLALLDSNIINELAGIGRKMEIVELNLDPQFESRYIDQLALPEAAEVQS